MGKKAREEAEELIVKKCGREVWEKASRGWNPDEEVYVEDGIEYALD